MSVMSASGPSTICLNMIVKDEAPIIAATLANITAKIPFAYYVICDTGSSDDTKGVISRFFADAGIPGEIHDDAWCDFGTNRSLALARAFSKTDYVLVWDADDRVEGTVQLPARLSHDQYRFRFDGNGHWYSRALLFNNRLHWRFVGVLHEYASCMDAQEPTTACAGGAYHVLSGRMGNRSADPRKYEKDALVLEAAYDTAAAATPPDPIRMRYAFYCGNSWRDAGNAEAALRWYRRVVDMPDAWSEERYVAALDGYGQCVKLGRSVEGIPLLIDAISVAPQRVEAVSELVRHYCCRGKDSVAYALYSIVAPWYEAWDPAQDDLSSRLFARKHEYTFLLPYYVIIVALRVGKPATAVAMYDAITRAGGTHSQWWIHNLFTNLKLAVDAFPADDPRIFQALLAYVDTVRETHGVVFESGHLLGMQRLIDRYRPLMVAPLPPTGACPLGTSPSPRPDVLVTMTTSKRLALFVQTMNSIVRSWTDLGVVAPGSFVVIDDGSSEHDRATMQASYPWATFIWKGADSVGHQASMNMIHARLRVEARYKYWVHLEDDWLFFRREAYLTRAIAALESAPARAANVRQLLFNRNYAEVYEQYTSTGGVKLCAGVVLHEFSPPGGDATTHGYWPHYSLRPSVTDVATVLALGDYHSDKTFFERAYAQRYAAAGWKSAFFDSVTCQHIGKLTTERNGMNAYALNGVQQFDSVPPPALAAEEAAVHIDHFTTELLALPSAPANVHVRSPYPLFFGACIALIRSWLSSRGLTSDDAVPPSLVIFLYGLELPSAHEWAGTDYVVVCTEQPSGPFFSADNHAVRDYLRGAGALWCMDTSDANAVVRVYGVQPERVAIVPTMAGTYFVSEDVVAACSAHAGSTESSDVPRVMHLGHAKARREQLLSRVRRHSSATTFQYDAVAGVLDEPVRTRAVAPADVHLCVNGYETTPAGWVHAMHRLSYLLRIRKPGSRILVEHCPGSTLLTPLLESFAPVVQMLPPTVDVATAIAVISAGHRLWPIDPLDEAAAVARIAQFYGRLCGTPSRAAPPVDWAAPPAFTPSTFMDRFVLRVAGTALVAHAIAAAVKSRRAVVVVDPEPDEPTSFVVDCAATNAALAASGVPATVITRAGGDADDSWTLSRAVFGPDAHASVQQEDVTEALQRMFTTGGDGATLHVPAMVDIVAALGDPALGVPKTLSLTIQHVTAASAAPDAVVTVTIPEYDRRLCTAVTLGKTALCRVVSAAELDAFTTSEEEAAMLAFVKLKPRQPEPSQHTAISSN